MKTFEKILKKNNDINYDSRIRATGLSGRNLLDVLKNKYPNEVTDLKSCCRKIQSLESQGIYDDFMLGDILEIPNTYIVPRLEQVETQYGSTGLSSGGTVSRDGPIQVVSDYDNPNYGRASGSANNIGVVEQLGTYKREYYSGKYDSSGKNQLKSISDVCLVKGGTRWVLCGINHYANTGADYDLPYSNTNSCKSLTFIQLDGYLEQNIRSASYNSGGVVVSEGEGGIQTRIGCRRLEDVSTYNPAYTITTLADGYKYLTSSNIRESIQAVLGVELKKIKRLYNLATNSTTNKLQNYDGITYSNDSKFYKESVYFPTERELFGHVKTDAIRQRTAEMQFPLFNMCPSLIKTGRPYLLANLSRASTNFGASNNGCRISVVLEDGSVSDESTHGSSISSTKFYGRLVINI